MSLSLLFPCAKPKILTLNVSSLSGVGDKVEVPIMPMIGNRLQIRGWPAGTASDSEDTIRFAMTTGVETRIET